MSIENIRISIDSKVDQIDVVDAVVRGAIEKMGFDEREADEIELAIHEAIVNAIVHGYPSSAEASDEAELPKVELTLLLEPGALTAEIRDRGDGFDPSVVPSPLAPENLLRGSGRGLLYMRTFMDEADITAHPEGGSVVRMVKRKSHSG
jgi:serine/threonine-protein kinase RsbW